MNLYVGNLSYDANEQELEEAFARYGSVESVTIVKDRETGRSRGFAFVEMPNTEEARAAVEGLNLERVGDRAVTVNEARPRTEKRGGRGGGGRGHGGRSRR